MKKNILTYGIISGIIVSVLMLINMSYFSHCEGTMDYNTSMAIGYATMLIAFSLVFVGIRNYRNKFNGGLISFGKAFKVGILIVLVASTFYVLAWLIDYYFFMPDFAEKYAAQTISRLKADGGTAIEIEKKTKEMANFIRWFKNPLFVIGMTYVEILPVGLIVTLISSFILKKKVA